MKINLTGLIKILFSVLFFSAVVFSQTTEFTYQGRLLNASAPAGGNYDFEFALYDAVSGGAQIGSTLTRASVAVTDGNFSVKLDFGSQFPGANRFLEIRVRQTGGGTFTALTPRQSVTSSPYSVKSLTADSALNAANATTAATATNALSLGGVAAGQYVLTGDARLSDARPPTAGSTNYVQNQNAGPQASSNFNISGTGTADTFNVATRYSIGGNRVLSNAGTSNLFAGADAGPANTTGSENSFFGRMAGYLNTTGGSNSFFGVSAGQSNSTAVANSFFGVKAGHVNTIGAHNSFLGWGAGYSNITGSGNSFFGMSAGTANTTGSYNTIVGIDADVGANNLTFATAIGANAIVSSSNTVVLGRGTDTVRIPGGLNVTGSFTGNFTVPVSNITGILAAANGGSGLGSPGASGNFLRSNGTGWTSSTLQAADIPGGSANYVQNTTSAQASSNFNISGTGTANIFNAGTQYNVGGQQALRADTTRRSVYVGIDAGPPTYNTGSDNSYFGQSAGQIGLGGAENSYFGASAGFNNNGGNFNSLFGYHAGYNSTYADSNSFFGYQSGTGNTTGNKNVFLGAWAGESNTTGSHNTAIGYLANFSGGLNTNRTAVGSSAFVSQDNSLVLGGINGINFATADTKVGIGTTAPAYKLHVVEPSNQGLRVQTNTAGGTVASFGANGEFQIDSNGVNGGRLKVLENGNVGIGMPVGGNVNNKLDVVGTVGVWTLGSGGSVALCWHTGGYNLSTCGSSLRYKKNLSPFTGGLGLLRRFQPITFDWKEGGMHDLGLGAEDVAAIEPLLVTYNKDGQVEGVKYDRVGVVLINAVKEQQAQIEGQQKEIDELKQTGVILQQKLAEQTEASRRLAAQVEALKSLLCRSDPKADICKGVVK